MSELDKNLVLRYDEAVELIKTAIMQSQYKALQSSNHVQLQLYYGIGRYISHNSRIGFWNTGALKYISNKLNRDMPGLRGFSVTNLKMMRTFYEQWICLDSKSSAAADDLNPTENEHSSKSSATADENNQLTIGMLDSVSNDDFPMSDFLSVPFSQQYIILSKVKELRERYFYIRLCANEHLSKDALKVAIARDEFHHQAALPNNFNERLTPAEQARKAVLAFKDEYVLDFINVEELGARDIEDVDERVVENKIVQNIRNFIMTFGHDFAFLGNQYRVEALGHTHIIDLLFYNRELSCLVAVELKTGVFKTAYLGQLNGYLTILDDFVRKPNENKSIGILLCKSVDKPYAEYMVRTYDNPMGVATFKTADNMPEKLKKALPDIEELKKLL
jgi:predicted nuclease of restriction endonuclease-like (RecB) superfamily